MRDPNRIPKVLARLQAVWMGHPDLRLGQLIENVYKDYVLHEHKCIYNIEDEVFVDEIERWYDNLTYGTTGQYEVRKKGKL